MVIAVRASQSQILGIVASAVLTSPDMLDVKAENWSGLLR
jgi:hypothetical protein